MNIINTASQEVRSRLGYSTGEGEDHEGHSLRPQLGIPGRATAAHKVQVWEFIKSAFPASGQSLRSFSLVSLPHVEQRLLRTAARGISSTTATAVLPSWRCGLLSRITAVCVVDRSKILRATGWSGWLLSSATSASVPAGLWWTAWLPAATPTAGRLCVRSAYLVRL